MSLLEQCLAGGAYACNLAHGIRLTFTPAPPLEPRHDKGENDEGENPLASEVVVAFPLEANQLLRQRIQILGTTLQDQQEGIAPGPDTGTSPLQQMHRG